MRKYLIIILGCMYFSVSSGQSLINQIEHAYSGLDSTSYINNVILSYGRFLNEINEESRETFLQMLNSKDDSARTTSDYNRIDSIYLACEMLNSQEVKRFGKVLKTRTPVYFLNLKQNGDQTLQVDTGKLKFNLFYFGKKYKKGLYVYCYNGEYGCQCHYYYTFSTKIANNVPKVFKRIMRKHPKYLLLCSDLEGANSILYVLNNEIYIYKIVQMKEYKLDYYMKHRASIDIWK